MADIAIPLPGQSLLILNAESLTKEEILAYVAPLIVDSVVPDAIRQYQLAAQAALATVAPDVMRAKLLETIDYMEANGLFPIIDENGYAVRNGKLLAATRAAWVKVTAPDSVTVLMEPIPEPDGSTPAQLGAPAAATATAST